MFYYNDAGLITNEVEINTKGKFEKITWSYKFGYGEKKFYEELGKKKRGEPNNLDGLTRKMINSPNRYQWFHNE